MLVMILKLERQFKNLKCYFLHLKQKRALVCNTINRYNKIKIPNLKMRLLRIITEVLMAPIIEMVKVYTALIYMALNNKQKTNKWLWMEIKMKVEKAVKVMEQLNLVKRRLLVQGLNYRTSNIYIRKCRVNKFQQKA